jgi:hypothetical protein
VPVGTPCCSRGIWLCPFWQHQERRVGACSREELWDLGNVEVNRRPSA